MAIGVKLPTYLTKLLECSGYDNLQSLSKLSTNQLIDELEAYATENLDASDLGLPNEGKYYFSQRTMKFHVLPGHKHLLVAAAETALKLLHQQPENEIESEFEKATEENDQSSMEDQDEKPSHMNGLHFLSEFSTLGNNRATRTPKRITSDDLSELTVSVEEEQHSLVQFLKTWIARKVLNGDMEPFLFGVDYKIQVYRPKSSNPATRTDIYSFVCLRCNTTIRAFKRPNGQNWNAANVCRHISTVHFLLASSRTQKHHQRSNNLVSSLSTPPLSDSPIEQDPLD